MTEEFVITGIGIVSAAGIGKEAFWDALINGKSGLKKITRFDTRDKKSHFGGEVAGFDLDAIFPDRRFRRAANISKYCLGSSKLAIDDAGLDPCKWDGTKVGLVVGVTHGAISYSREFHAALVKEGPASVSPMLFSDSVLNIAASNVSIAFSIKGAAHTIVGGIPAGLDAIAYAIKIMENSCLDICLVGGAEEIDSIVFDTYARFGLLSPSTKIGKGAEGIKPFGADRNGFIIGEGACALAIEKKKTAVARGARIYADLHEVKTTVHAIPANLPDLFRNILNDEDTYISTGANGTKNDIIESGLLHSIYERDLTHAHPIKKPFIGNIKPIVGECFAAGSLMQAASAAMVLYNGIIPPSTIRFKIQDPRFKDLGRFNPFPEKSEVKKALVSSIGLKGEGSFLILKNPN